MRLRTAFIVWGLLALVGWVAVLLPAYVLIDQGPELVQAVFGDRGEIMSPEDIEALGRIAPAAGSGAAGQTAK